MSTILRIVPQGKIAEHYKDDDCDLDAPCDLVLLRAEPCEEEIDRRAFSSGHKASAAMRALLKMHKDPSVTHDLAFP